jgi:hypothetical protein
MSEIDTHYSQYFWFIIRVFESYHFCSLHSLLDSTMLYVHSFTLLYSSRLPQTTHTPRAPSHVHTPYPHTHTGNLTRSKEVTRSLIQSRSDEALLLLLGHTNKDIVTAVSGALVNVSGDPSWRGTYTVQSQSAGDCLILDLT